MARGLGRSFAGRPAVAGLSFEVEEGEVFGLLGPNGAGKTTTVRLLCALLSRTTGEAAICGFALGRDDAQVRAAVGLLTEQPGLYDRLSALDNLLYFSRLYGVPDAEAKARIDRYLLLFGLKGREHEKVGGYSKGMRQKVAIARALVHAPRVAFLDEPTSGLDPEASATVREAIRGLAREGRTIVLCTHNLDEAEKLCSRLAVVKGRILAMGTVAELQGPKDRVEIGLERDGAQIARALAGAPFLSSLSVEEQRLVVTLRGSDAIPELVAKVVAAGGRITSVRPVERRLEQIYLELVSGTLPVVEAVG